MSDPREAKRAIRDRVRAARRARDSVELAAAERGITAAAVALLEELDPRTIAAYLSLPDEPSTAGILTWARARGVRVLLPVVRRDGFLDWVEHGDDVTVGAFGLIEPVGEPLPVAALGAVDLIVAPASAVDRSGIRMGWGRGFYDAALGALERRPPVHAVVFDDEILDHVPAEGHDQPVDGVIAPSGRITF